MKTDVFKKSKCYWGPSLLSLPSLQEESELCLQNCRSKGAAEGDQMPGGSCCINNQGWLWIQHGGAPSPAPGTTSEHLLPLPAEVEGWVQDLYGGAEQNCLTLSCFLECCSRTDGEKP